MFSFPSLRHATLIAALLSLAACVATYPVVGYFDQYNELMRGTVANNLLTGSSTIKVETVNSHVKGTGYATVTHVPSAFSVAGQRGVAVVEFEDGRRIRCDYTVHGWIHGSGTGTDQDGHPVSFTFGMKEEEALAFINQHKTRLSSKPDLPPVYAPKETRAELGFCTGTGFFVSATGHLVTNFHVIEDGTKITVTTIDGKELTAEVLATDPGNDVALLKVESDSQPLTVAMADDAARGNDVFTLGYPLIQLQGNEQKATFGRINALSGIRGDSRFFQVDVPIQPGNSGGPLLNKAGQVVGITTATLNELRALRESGSLPQNVNYALKSGYVRPLISPYIEPADVPPAQTSDYATLIKRIESSVALIIVR